MQGSWWVRTNLDQGTAGRKERWPSHSGNTTWTTKLKDLEGGRFPAGNPGSGQQKSSRLPRRTRGQRTLRRMLWSVWDSPDVGTRRWLEGRARLRNQGFVDIVAHTYNTCTQESEARELITSSKAD